MCNEGGAGKCHEENEEENEAAKPSATPYVLNEPDEDLLGLLDLVGYSVQVGVHDARATVGCWQIISLHVGWGK
jgi:hypothetical protein